MIARKTLRGVPQPKGWHPQKATAKWLAYKEHAEALATRTVAERERRDGQEHRATHYARAEEAKADKGQ